MDCCDTGEVVKELLTGGGGALPVIYWGIGSCVELTCLALANQIVMLIVKQSLCWMVLHAVEAPVFLDVVVAAVVVVVVVVDAAAAESSYTEGTFVEVGVYATAVVNTVVGFDLVVAVDVEIGLAVVGE